MFKFSIKFLPIILIFSFFSVPQTQGQVDLPSNFPTTADYLTLKIRPENPKPDEQARASLELYLTDLKKAQISWFLNGELQEEGFGITNFDFITSPAGEAQRISVVIDTFEGDRINKELTIRPAEVDLVWNANTYTPPFYKGRALLTGNGGELVVTAIPNITDSSGEKINSQVLNYLWYKDGTFLSNDSGYGKSSVKIKRDSISRPFSVKVMVESLDGITTAEEALRIEYQSPEVLVYENHPLYGILFNRALKSLELDEQEVTLSAVPFFFSSVMRDGDFLDYIWSQNNRPIQSQDSKSSVTFRQTGGSQFGEVDISVTAKHINDFRQTSKSEMFLNIEN